VAPFFSSERDFSVSGEDGDFDLLETLESLTNSEGTESAQDATERAQILRAIEVQIQALRIVNGKPF
jgi:RNA polymerase sigma-70 factor (ECF subfamily)